MLALMKEVVTLGRPTWQGAVGGLQQTASKSLNPVNNPHRIGSGSFLLEPSHENPILADLDSQLQWTQLSCAQTFAHRYCEIINVCFFSATKCIVVIM